MGWGVVEGIAIPRQKINLLCLQNDKFGWTLTQFLTGRKHGRSLKALVHGFYGSIVKLSLRNSAKLSKYSQSDQKGRRLHHRPLNTPLRKRSFRSVSYRGGILWTKLTKVSEIRRLQDVLIMIIIIIRRRMNVIATL